MTKKQIETDPLADLKKIDLPFDVEEVDPVCHQCIRDQLKKYEKHISKDGVPSKDKFRVMCTGIPKHVINPAQKALLTEEEYKELEAIEDPVKFAERYLFNEKGEPFIARDYQKIMLRCLHGDSYVYMANGEAKKIKDIKVGDKVVSYNVKRKTFSKYYPVSNVFNNGVRDLYKIKLDNGDTLKVTDDHPILAYIQIGKKNQMLDCPSYKVGYKSLKEGLKVGDRVYVASNFGYFGNNNNVSLAKLLGYLISDGYISIKKKKTTVSFTSIRKEYVIEVQSLIKELFNEFAEIKYRPAYTNSSCSHKESYYIHYHKKNKRLIDFLKNINCTLPENREMSLLQYAFSFGEKALSSFINRCWSGDGCVYSRENDYLVDDRTIVSLASGNREFLELYRLLLKKIGIHSSHIYRMKSKDQNNKGITLTITRLKDILSFFSYCGLIYGKEEQSLQAIKATQNREDHSKLVYKRHFKNTVRTRITSIEYIGKDIVYDIEVPHYHNFIANNIIVHNCRSKRAVYRCGRRIGKTTAVVIRILHRIFTTKSIKVLVVGPQKKHAEEIFNRVRDFIYNNPILSGAVAKDISSPYFCLQLKNGAEVKGFAGGTKGTHDGTAIRGSDGDLILCVPKGTQVSTSEFGLRPVETLTLNDTILGGNEDGIEVGEITKLMKSKNTLVTIPTVLGMLKCTPEHPLFDGEKDVFAKDAEEVIFSLYHKDLNYSPRVILARLMGFVYGDGWITQEENGGQVGFSGQEKDLEQINEDLFLLGDTKKQIYTRYCENLERGIKGTGSTIVSRYIYHTLINHCPVGKKVYQPLKVPEIIKNGHKGQKAAFLSGLFSAEATGIKYQTNNKTLRTIELSMKSSKEEWIQDWIHEIAKLLDVFGIRYNIKFKNYIDDILEEPRYTGYLAICNSEENIINFINKIGFCYNAEKTAQANKYKLYLHYKNNWRKDYWKLNRKIRLYPKLPRQEVMKRCNVDQLHTVKFHRKTYHPLYSEKLLTFNDYIQRLIWKDGYVKIPVIRENVRFSKEEVDVYNLTSGASNRYFANGIMTHNCEEADFIDDEAIQGAIMPILYTNAHAELIGFSTPCGLRKTFYTWCMDSPQYKEFYYNYTVLPWKDIIEKEKDSYTEEQWDHEMLALFGDSDAGVYKPSYIDRALTAYQYSDNHPEPGVVYAMGVDWNEKHGAEITVLGYSHYRKKFKIMDIQHVIGQDFTQLNSVSKVIEMNKKWNPRFVYVDSGNGCLYKDTIVQTKEGTKEIKDILVGDKVLSHKGEYKQVLSTKEAGSKLAYSVRASHCMYVTASKEHLHLVYRAENRFHDFDNLFRPQDRNLNNFKIQKITTKELDASKDFVVIPKQDISNTKSSLIVDLVNELKDIKNLQYDKNYVWTLHGYHTENKASAAKLIKKYKTSRATVQRTKRKAITGERMIPAERKLFKQACRDYGNSWYVDNYKKINRYIDILDPNFLNLYGWYLSEGHSGVNNIEICQAPCHYNKEFSELIDYCFDNWDCNLLVRKNGMKRLFILSSLLTRFFEKIGGTDCFNKFIDQRIIENNGTNLLPSLFWGDGHEHKYGLNISLTSNTLVFQIRQMLINNGILGGLHYIKPRRRNDRYHSLSQMMLYINANKVNYKKINKILKSNVSYRNGIFRRKYIELSDCFLSPLKKISKIGISKDMYDLTIEGDASFCANGFATHNSTNHELLLKAAQTHAMRGGDNATANLMHVLKKYDSGASIKIKDTVTKQEVKKQAKSFMVNSCVKLFEQGRIEISSHDQILEKQLRNYIIERMTPTGNPVYGLEDERVGDHRLDSFNLAAVAFQLEFDELLKQTFSTAVIAVPDPRRLLKPTEEEGPKIVDRPVSRDLSSFKNKVEEQVFRVPAGNLHDPLQGLRTNRPGWSTDEEEAYIERFLQKRYARNKQSRMSRNKPRRSNI